MPDKEKVYVALEGEGKIIVIDGLKKKVINRISLRERQGRDVVEYMPHNVQVAPDGSKVWVTANAMTKEERGVMNDGQEDDMMNRPTKQDQVIIIDPKKDRIVKRIALGADLHLAHVVVSAEGDYAYILSQDKGVLYKINTVTYATEARVELDAASGPHGLRLSPDGTKAYVALLNGKGLAVINTANGVVETLNLPGVAVQTAVTPNGTVVAVSLYDTKQVAIYHTDTKQLAFVNLPQEAKGPVQLYPTADSKYVYVADQGYYFNQPTNEFVYKVDLQRGAVVQTIKAGKAPHGVVVSSDRRYAYVTNLLSKDVSVIDMPSGKEVKRIKVGDMPNGISIWSIKPMGTP